MEPNDTSAKQELNWGKRIYSQEEYSKLKEALTISNTQREGYKTELESQVKLNNELAQELLRVKKSERILEAQLSRKSELTKERITVLNFEKKELSEALKQSQEEFQAFKEATARADNLYLNLNWEEPLPVDQALLKRIKELEALVKEAWDTGRGSIFCSKHERMVKEEWLKSKGINY